LDRRARRGEVPSFIGIDSPYETPRRPEIRIDTTLMSASQGAHLVLDLDYLAGDRFRIADPSAESLGK
jgi:adenylylsulfate kinase-like enzyme